MEGKPQETVGEDWYQQHVDACKAQGLEPMKFHKFVEHLENFARELSKQWILVSCGTWPAGKESENIFDVSTENTNGSVSLGIPRPLEVNDKMIKDINMTRSLYKVIKASTGCNSFATLSHLVKRRSQGGRGLTASWFLKQPGVGDKLLAQLRDLYRKHNIILPEK